MVNYTTFFDEGFNDNGKETGLSDLSLKDSWGAAGQVGMDYLINRDWLINMSVWYMDIDTTASYKMGGVQQRQCTPRSVGVYVLCGLSFLSSSAKPPSAKLVIK